jgi:hypothetical protein
MEDGEKVRWMGVTIRPLSPPSGESFTSFDGPRMVVRGAAISQQWFAKGNSSQGARKCWKDS